MSRRPASVRWRLTLWYAGAVALTVGLVSVAAFILVRARAWQDLGDLLEQHLELVSVIMAGPPEGELEEDETETVWLHDEYGDLEEQGVVTVFMATADDTLFYATEDWMDLGLDAALASAPRREEGRAAFWTWSDEEEEMLLLGSSALRRPGYDLFTVVAVNAEGTRRFAQDLALMLILLFPLTLLLAAAMGYLIAGRVLAPLDVMAVRAERITAYRLSERLPVENPRDELGRLALIFNDMLSRIERAFEELRRFTADASHALRTPLTAIRSVGEVGLQEGNGGDTYREVIGSMLEETDRLRALVENLLALTRAEGGQIRAEPQRFDLGQLAAETVERLLVLAEEGGQSLNLEAAGTTEVSADREMIRQALLNLVDNAIRHTPAGGSIYVRTRPLPGGHGMVEVTDTGPGIASEHLEHIFERFYRADPRAGEDVQGYGLGLAIARHAVVLNGGEITVESEPGSGTTFRVTLPGPSRIRE
ncbi:sensor histidine kinase [Gemmatimonadota bacterium]